jgi:hypothetical protein
VLACGGNDPDTPFGETAIIVVVNPEENDGNTEALPGFVADIYGGVDVDADPGGADTTDDTGLAVLHDLDPGDLDLVFDGDASLPFTIVAEGDVYDVAVAYDGDQVGLYSGFPIRYSIGGQIIEIPIDADPTDALSEDDQIVFFEDGIHVGDLLIQGSNVIVFGEGFAEHSVVIDGNLEVRGTNVRIRGVTITGDLSVWGNQFGMSFGVVQGATQLNGQAISFLRNVFCNGANVPSSNAALYDNLGLAPFSAPGEPDCP